MSSGRAAAPLKMGGTCKRVFDVLQERQYGTNRPTDLYTSSKDCSGFVERLSLCARLPVHSGCVNSIWWNAAGTLLLSGSDDHHLKLTEPYSGKMVVDYATAHRANIFSAKFLPFSNDAKLISCAGDGAVLYTDLEAGACQSSGGHVRPQLYLCPAGTTYEVLTWDAEPHCWLSCGEEGAVRCFDVRQHGACSVRGCTETVLLWAERAVTTIALNPACLWELAVATADGAVSLYDRRMVQPRQHGGALRQWTAPDLHGPGRRITAVQYAPTGGQLLVSYSADDVYLFDLSETEASDAPAPSAGAAAAAPCRPPVKRLRLRGDWSDTGPQARPERAAPQPPADNLRQPPTDGHTTHAQHAAGESGARRSGVSLHANLISQMSDVLQRLLTSELPSRPSHLPAPPSAAPAPPPDLSRRPVTRRVIERIRQRRALNVQQIVSDMGSLQTSGDPEPAAGGSDVTAETASEAVSSPQAAAPGAETRDTPAADAAAATIAADRSVRCEIGAVHSSGAGGDDGQPAERTASVASPEAAPAAPAAAGAAGGAGSGSAGAGGAVGVSPPVLGPYMDLETESVVVRSEPLVSLYYSPQSSTAGQISVESPQSAPAADAAPTATFAQRALLLTCGSAQTADRSEPADDGAGEHETETEAACSRAGAEHQRPRVIARYTGHRNARTMIKEANFWGSEHVLSGSDCGHVFVWHRRSARLVAVLEADRHVVNCVQPHPLDPLLATSGIDYDVKLWAPLAPEPVLDQQRAQELMARNALMLEETRDTITVPASFMIRMLASLSNRRGR